METLEQTLTRYSLTGQVNDHDPYFLGRDLTQSEMIELVRSELTEIASESEGWNEYWQSKNDYEWAASHRGNVEHCEQLLDIILEALTEPHARIEAQAAHIQEGEWAVFTLNLVVTSEVAF